MQQRFNSNAMKVSILRSDTAKIRQLVETGFPVNEFLFDDKNSTPLYYAANRKKTKAVATLLQLGAQPDLANKNSSNTPLFAAASHGDLEMVRDLLQHDADPNVPNKHDLTPVIQAAQATHLAEEMVRELINSDASMIANAQGRNPLHTVLYSPELVPMIVAAGGNINEVYQGQTPLMLNVERLFLKNRNHSRRKNVEADLSVVRSLIENGADPNTRYEKNPNSEMNWIGKSILEVAEELDVDEALLNVLNPDRPANVHESLPQPRLETPNETASELVSESETDSLYEELPETDSNSIPEEQPETTEPTTTELLAPTSEIRKKK